MKKLITLIALFAFLPIGAVAQRYYLDKFTKTEMNLSEDLKLFRHFTESASVRLRAEKLNNDDRVRLMGNLNWIRSSAYSMNDDCGIFFMFDDSYETVIRCPLVGINISKHIYGPLWSGSSDFVASQELIDALAEKPLKAVRLQGLEIAAADYDIKPKAAKKILKQCQQFKAFNEAKPLVDLEGTE